MRRELSLRCDVERRRARLRRGSRSAALLRVAALVALAAGLSGALQAQPPYRQELLLGFSSFDVGSMSSPNLVDLDGDGDLDAVVGADYGALSYFANTGSSGSPAFIEAIGTGSPFSGIDIGSYSSPELADLDGDGDFDAVVGEFGGTLLMFENTGSLSGPAFIELTGSANPFTGLDVGDFSRAVLSDLDGDGDLDAVVGAYDGILSYFANTGSSNSAAFVAVTGSGDPFSGIDVGDRSSPEIADLDGDGDLDMALGEQGATLLYFANTGSSSSPAFVQETGSSNPLAGFIASFASTPDLVDLDGDSDLDAVVGDNAGILYYLTNTGSSASPAFVAATGSASPFAGINVGLRTSAGLGDLDGDGDFDAVIGAGYGTLRTFVNTGSSNSPEFLELTGTGNPFAGIDVGSRSSPDLVDLDSDGGLDAVVGEDAGNLNYLVNSGSSGSPAFVVVTGSGDPFTGIDVGSRSQPGLEDLDGDNDFDALVGELNGTLRYFANSGSSSSPAFLEMTGSGNPFVGVDIGANGSPGLLDFDGDGDLDAVIGEDLGTLLYFSNTGSTSAPAFVQASGSGNPFAGLDVGRYSNPDLVDLDGDGDIDALVGEDNGRVVYFRSRAIESVFDNGFSDNFESGGLTAWSNF